MWKIVAFSALVRNDGADVRLETNAETHHADITCQSVGMAACGCASHPRSVLDSGRSPDGEPRLWPVCARRGTR